MNRKGFVVKRIILGLLLALFITSVFGCVRPEPQVREEILEQSDQTHKGPWEGQIPGD